MPGVGRAPPRKIGTHTYNAKMEAERRVRKQANKYKVEAWFKEFDTDHTVRSPCSRSPASHAAVTRDSCSYRRRASSVETNSRRF